MVNPPVRGLSLCTTAIVTRSGRTDPSAAADAVAAYPPVTGICAFNDETAALAGLTHLGQEAPKALAVIGMDDLPGSAVARPPLTAGLHHHRRALRTFVAATLHGELIPAEPEYRLVIRKSA